MSAPCLDHVQVGRDTPLLTKGSIVHHVRNFDVPAIHRMKEVMTMMHESNTALSLPWRDFYNTLAWVMLDLNEPQFLLAWRIWSQQRKKKNGAPQTWARAFLQRLS